MTKDRYALARQYQGRGFRSDPALGAPRQFGLEQAMEFINDDELVKVTPAAIRLRKMAAS
jgi:predicted membrane GTPase involved in stress response